jgi:subtilisin-like proprotein convertase family protein
MSYRSLLTVAASFGLMFCIASPAMGQSGGPDVFGYNYQPATFDFVPLANVASTQLVLIGDDGEVSVPLPWAFSYYGAPYTDILVSSNGALTFRVLSGTQVSYSNACLPSSPTSNVDLAVFWDDLNPSSGGGVYWMHDTSSGNDRFIVSWESVPHYSNTGAATFQAHLYPSGEVQFHWQDTDFGSASYNNAISATIGIQDTIGGTQGAGNVLQWSCNTAVPAMDGTATSFSPCEDLDGDGAASNACGGADCDDADPNAFPGNSEICDGIDNDCDPSTDETVDGDTDQETICDGDCDDTDPNINTNATELCDGIDNDCQNGADFDVAGEADADADGSLSCEDCDDANAAEFPGNPEVCDGFDNDCDGSLPAIETVDADGDGSPDCYDCNNADPLIFPGAPELCDGLDNDCNGALLGGGSGLPTSLTTTFTGGNSSSGNIFDINALSDIEITSFDAHVTGSTTGTMDVWWKAGTGYNSTTANTDWTFHETVAITGVSTTGSPTPVPLAAPILLSAGQTYSIYMLSSIGMRYTNGSTVGTIFASDANMEVTEGYGCGSAFSCSFVPRVWNGTIYYQESGSLEVDDDGDGYVECAWIGTSAPILGGGDCDDGDPAISPAAAEICDGIDNDCDGTANFDVAGEVDLDADAALSCADCDDSNAVMFPGNSEVCDGYDNDCDGVLPPIETVDADGDGSPDCYDCGPANALVYPGAPELCDSLDNDCDGGFLGGGSGTPSSLTTTFATNNGSSGNIFDIIVLEDIDITSFDAHVSGSGAGTMDVYWRAGSGYSANTSNAGWNFHETVAITGVGTSGSPTPVPLTTPISMIAGETYSIYMLSSLGIRYTTGTTLSAVVAQDASMQVTEGHGCAAAFSCSNTPRIWNGTIYYLNPGSLELDDDGDGFVECTWVGDPSAGLAGDDCDDDEATAFPGATELCDFIDNDCNSLIDEGHDTDFDGQTTCEGDCDDTDANNFLGNSEVCDNADNDCDGAVDDQDAIAAGTGVGTAFPDASGGPVTVEAVLTVDTIIVDVDVTVDITHSSLQEVSISVVSPAGTVVELSSLNGGSGADYTATTFDDQALNSIVGATPPMTGSFYPEGFLADFNGEGTLGTWQLILGDSLAGSANGVINSWSITITTAADADGDGYTSCNAAQPNLQDCDDTDVSVFPGATEQCNGEDDDCDGTLPADEIDADSDGVIACADCNDADAAVFPGNVEVCDSAGVDNDCDPSTDEAVDGDGDGSSACDGDCDDTLAAVNVGAAEVCNGIDDDCNGLADADVSGEVDVDLDGSLSCDDCDDNDPANFPGNLEICDSQDNDCDPGTDEAQDSDGDGFSACTGGDCNGADATVYPGAPELCDGQDNDCDGQLPADEVDNDGDTSIACADCDDNDADNFPGNGEVCDGQDNDCDANSNELFDFDGDLVSACGGDCDETDDAVYPGAPELCDDLDNDCDPATDELADVDGDTVTPCDGDCDDSNAAVLPGVAEACDGEDTDCDGTVGVDEVDADDDGVLLCDGDCDDADDTSAPGFPELCDGIDNDCDGGIGDEEADTDGDGLTPCDGDCDDTNADSLPGATEVCDGNDNDCDTVLPDDEADADADGWMLCEDDCDDTEELANPGASEDSVELCADGIDNDCDGDLDDADADCAEVGDDDDSVGDDDDTGDDDDSADSEIAGCSCTSSLVAGVDSGAGVLLLLLLGLAPLRRRR